MEREWYDNLTYISKEEYNKVPVHYCEDCLSLAILSWENTDYCDKCGSTRIGETDIHTWEKLKHNRSRNFNLRNNGREKTEFSSGKSIL